MKYLTRSTVLFLMLYSLVALVAGNLFLDGGMTLRTGTHIAIGVLLLQYLLGPLLIRAAMDVDWSADLPSSNQQFLEALCRRERIPRPMTGIIYGSIPSAFTFGWTQGSARIVVTSGLIESLTPQEVDAVVAHEVGHIKHRDYLVMTAAAMTPMALYQLYNQARQLESNKWVSHAIFAAYSISELIVLSLSRTREFWADEFAASATGNPSLVSSALVKVCYGMAKVEREGAWARTRAGDQRTVEAIGNTALASKIGALGIAAAEPGLALSGPSPHAVVRLMKWDLVNPWARIYQYVSTHPLTALRIRALNRLSHKHGRAVVYQVPEWSWIQWRLFPIEFILWAGPFILSILILAAAGLNRRGEIPIPGELFGAAAIGVFALWTGRILYRYQGDFERATIQELIEDTAPSGMRPRAVRLEARVVGRGDPAVFWSPDLMIQDYSGTLFMLDRQSIPLARLFQVPNAENLIGHWVEVEGWYRREPVPYIEMSRIGCPDDPGLRHRSYSKWIQLAFAGAGSLALYWIAA
jgi:Zn-dependent protease with chaperone function